MEKRYTRLQFKIHEPLKIKDLTYTFKVLNSTATKVEFEDAGNFFDDQGFTKWFNIFKSNKILHYEISYRGEMIQRVSAKSFPKPNNWSVFDFKTTAELTKKVKENIKEIYLDDGEVAWYLVKESEAVISWSKRIFKKPLASSDWDILRTNNPHMSNLITVGVLQPGQIVILSNSTTATDLPNYKKYAKEAQKKLDILNKDKQFDALFFAQNYEFFDNALNNEDYIGISSTPVESLDGTGAILATTAKNTVDGALLFVEETKKKTLGSYSQIVKNYITEHENKTRKANPKHFDKFEKANAKLFRDFENSISKKIFQWDTGIKTNKLRQHLKSTAFVKGPSYQGGVPAYLKNMDEVGRVTKVLKQGGNLMIGISLGEAGINIYKAAETGDIKKTRKAVLVEPLKVGGSLVGGRVGAAAATTAAVLVVGVGTGGIGLVVIGACAVVGGLGGGIIGGWLGEMVGTGADKTIDWATK